MTHGGVKASVSAQGVGSYSQAFRKTLLTGALILAVLPVPVAALSLLPAYRVHARFLAFYTPLVCLLLLAYLFYVRDSLARMIFSDILNPLPETDPYRPTWGRDAVRRVIRRLRSALLAVLPILLVLTSFYCFNRYTARLSDSVRQVIARQAALGRAPDSSATASAAPSVRETTRPGSTTSPGRRRPAGRATGDSTRAADTADAEALDLQVSRLERLSPREQVLETTEIDSIPLFTELSALYIGIFAAALTGLILMALKEHAQVAMGLSEQDLVFGGWAATDAEQT